jgi:hypothetical protein
MFMPWGTNAAMAGYPDTNLGFLGRGIVTNLKLCSFDHNINSYNIEVKREYDHKSKIFNAGSCCFDWPAVWGRELAAYWFIGGAFRFF